MATRKMNFKMLKHHINEVCKLIDASDAGMAAETSDDGTLDLAGPESEVRSPDDEHQTSAMDSRSRRGAPMSKGFPGFTMNGPLHQKK